jgi:hypothetical protein
VTEQELRALVRDAIARHGGRPAASSPAAHGGAADHPLAVIRRHPSHGLFSVSSGADSGGPCVIEPAVSCTHCGYCKSYGH